MRPFVYKVLEKWLNVVLPENRKHFRYIWPELKVTHHIDGTRSFSYKRQHIARSCPASLLRGYCAERLFLIGSGPSIKSQNIAKLQNQTVMLMNGAFYLTEEHSFKKVIFVVTDFEFMEQNPTLILKALESEACCIFTSECIRVIAELYPEALKDRPFIISEEIGRFSNQAKPSLSALRQWADEREGVRFDGSRSTMRQFFGFCSNPDLGFFNCGTVMYAALQFGAYTQPASIYLLGFDIGNATEPRFYETASKTAPSRLLEDFESIIQPAFEYGRKCLAEKNIQVYNLSPISSLPESVIPLRAFDEVLSDAL